MRSAEGSGSAFMGRIARLVAAGIPSEPLVQLSVDLFEAGKTARRLGAPADQIADWCRGCAMNSPAGIERLIGLGLPAAMIAMLLNALADLGWRAQARGVSDTLGELVVELIMTGSRAEQEAPDDASTEAAIYRAG